VVRAIFVHFVASAVKTPAQKTVVSPVVSLVVALLQQTSPVRLLEANATVAAAAGVEYAVVTPA